MSAATTASVITQFPAEVSEKRRGDVAGLFSLVATEVQVVILPEGIDEALRQAAWTQGLGLVSVSAGGVRAGALLGEGAPQGILSEYMERHGDDLLQFISSSLDAEEQCRFSSELASVALAALESASLLPLARFFGDWEESVSLKLDTDLAEQIGRALEEAEGQLPSDEIE